MKTPKLERTKNYDLFELHPCNRDIKNVNALEESMRKHGFMPSCPLHCVRNGNGKLKVVRGHHRYETAKKLGLPVYYVIDDTKTDIFELEGSSNQLWNSTDFVVARAKSGNPNYKGLLEMKEKHGLTMTVAASLASGEGAVSHNAAKKLKSGTFKLADENKSNVHATQVLAITDACRELGVPFATSTAFVTAISYSLHVEGVTFRTLLNKITTHYAMMRRRSTRDDYLEEIERVYNYGTRKDKQIAIKHQALLAADRRRIATGLRK